MLFFLRFGLEAVVFSVGEILPLRCFLLFVISRCSKLIYSQNDFILLQILFSFEGAMWAL